TFSSPSTIALPLGRPVRLGVTIKAKTPGVHSAVLNLDEVDGLKAVHQVQTTVVAAEELTSADEFKITHTATVEWMYGRSYFFYVPPGTPSLNVQMTIAMGNARMLLMRPSGDSRYELATYSTDACKYQTGGSCSQAVVKPEPGVWEVLIENKNTRGDSRFVRPNRTTFTVTAEILGNTERTNKFESDLTVSFTSNSAELWTYEFDVKPGTKNLVSEMENVSPSGADLDLYLFDCTTGQCMLKDLSQRDNSDERVEVQQPSPGKWKVVVDPASTRYITKGLITFNM
ncbi:MAG TPA: hypothetical protein VFY60_17490, partial [Pyrinomonadaceae bacterium]|nr:hypothetical protein [Pyrinomonadaceae bacterium]